MLQKNIEALASHIFRNKIIFTSVVNYKFSHNMRSQVSKVIFMCIISTSLLRFNCSQIQALNIPKTMLF